MDETWLRRLSLVLLPVGLAIAALGFGVAGTIEGLLGVGVIVAGVVISILVPETDGSEEVDDAANQTNRRVIQLISLVGGIALLGYVIASFT